MDNKRVGLIVVVTILIMTSLGTLWLYDYSTIETYSVSYSFSINLNPIMNPTNNTTGNATVYLPFPEINGKPCYTLFNSIGVDRQYPNMTIGIENTEKGWALEITTCKNLSGGAGFSSNNAINIPTNLSMYIRSENNYHYHWCKIKGDINPFRRIVTIQFHILHRVLYKNIFNHEHSDATMTRINEGGSFNNNDWNEMYGQTITYNPDYITLD